MKKKRGLIFLFGLFVASLILAQVEVKDLLGKKSQTFKSNKILTAEELKKVKLKRGQALIWYLGHSGWGVETVGHFMVFDYYKPIDQPNNACLANGWILPDEIKDKQVVVFISHAHPDHYDKKILDWEQKIPKLKYVWGWKSQKGKRHVCFDKKRKKIRVMGLSIHNIYHEGDGIPESAFLVEVDGISFFHSGDHGNGPPPLKKFFTENIQYLAGLKRDIDFIFIPIWGEEFYPIKHLKPKVVFPMHMGGREEKLTQWANKSQKKYKKIIIHPPSIPGDRYLYSK